jgi:hypothetical protein
MDRTTLKQAVEMLIASDEYSSIRREVVDMVSSDRPKRFADNLETLNSLIELGKDSMEALNNVFSLIERKRRERPSVRKSDYQRDYMRQRRKRIAKAVELESIMRGKAMSPDEKSSFIAAISADWMTKRDKALAQHPEANWTERNRISGDFWQYIDSQLDTELAEAKRILDTPNRRVRRVVRVEHQPKTELGKKLKDALSKRK